MKKYLIRLLLGILLLWAIYFVLTFFFTIEIVSNRFAIVTIKNESGQHAKKVILRHNRGEIEVSGLDDKKEVRLIFKNESESSYKIFVTLSDDRTLTSDEVYFELGYRGTETIRLTDIITNNNW